MCTTAIVAASILSQSFGDEIGGKAQEANRPIALSL